MGSSKNAGAPGLENRDALITSIGKITPDGYLISIIAGCVNPCKFRI
jgi:hypothetical protein